MPTQPAQRKRLVAILAVGLLAMVVIGRLVHREEEPPFQPVVLQQPQGAFFHRFPIRSQALPPDAEQALAQCKLPSYELRLAPGDLNSLENQSFNNQTYRATFVLDGRTYENGKVRVRGSWSRSWPKKSLKITFEQEKPFKGQKSLNLNSAWRDPAFVREVLAYEVYRACGVPASACRMVRLQVNGSFYGIFVEIEQPDKAFLARHGLKGAELYKAASRGRDADERDLGQPDFYRAAYNKETQKLEGNDALVRFCHELAHTSAPLEFFDKQVQLDEYTSYLAATVLVQNWDCFNKNHYVAFDREGTGKWVVIPWDLDRTFGDHWNMRFDETRLPLLLGTRSMPGVTGWNRLEERYFSEPKLRARFLDRLSELLDREFTAEKLFPVLDQLQEAIGPAAGLDRARWPSTAGDFAGGIEELRSFIKDRRGFLQQEIQRLRGM